MNNVIFVHGGGPAWTISTAPFAVACSPGLVAVARSDLFILLSSTAPLVSIYEAGSIGKLLLFMHELVLTESNFNLYRRGLQDICWYFEHQILVGVVSGKVRLEHCDPPPRKDNLRKFLGCVVKGEQII